MRVTKLRQSGGSVIVSVPKAYLDELGLKADTPVEIGVADGKIVISPRSPGRVGIAARLAQCDFDRDVTDDERAWLDDTVRGDELI